MTLSISAGIPTAFQRSYAYDNSNYIQADAVQATIAATGSSSAKFTAFIKKQLRSITGVPTVAPTANDQLTITLTSLYPQVFGTATGGDYRVAGANNLAITGTSSTVYGGTNTATGSNQVIFTLTSFGTAPAFNPFYQPIDGGTFTVVVANNAGTNTQTGYVFPQGPFGGLSVNPGDVLQIAKGTDTVGSYLLELETTFTPGSALTI